MDVKLLLLLLLLLLGSSNGVKELEHESLKNALLDGRDEWFVKFHVPWCGHCRALKPKWEKLDDRLKGIARVGSVDCTKENALCDAFDVKGYPTLIYIKKNREMFIHGGKRSYEELIQFAVDMNKGRYGKVVARPVPKLGSPTLHYSLGKFFGMPTLQIFIVGGSSALVGFLFMFYCFAPRGSIEDFDYLFESSDGKAKGKNEEKEKESKKDK